MFTPVLNPNSSSSTKTNANSVSSIPKYQVELGKILCKHDPTAVRLYDFINYVKVFRYNPTEFRWENNSFIEGNLFLYKRKELINNQTNQVYAFAIIQEDQNLIQPISIDMTEQADKLCLFYEIKKHDQSLVYSLHFSNENECLRVHKFIHQILQTMKEQQNRLLITGELQQKPVQEQSISGNVNQLQLTINRPNSVTPQLGSSQQRSIHVSGRQSTPLANSNMNTNDPTSSLKRLLNIPNQNIFDNETNSSSTQNSSSLLPPSAFTSSGTVSSSIGANYSNNQSISREHLRNVFLHLVQTNDQFVDTIHQACLNRLTE